MTKHIHIHNDPDDGVNDPDFHAGYADFVLERVRDEHPDATVEIEDGPSNVVFVDGKRDDDMTNAMRRTWWDEYCAENDR